jgi:hypothetical protein
MYRLYNQGGSDHSAVTNMYSVATSRTGTPLPAHQASPATTPHHHHSRDTLHLLNAGMSHSHTLPHSLSHHHSKLRLVVIPGNLNMFFIIPRSCSYLSWKKISYNFFRPV